MVAATALVSLLSLVAAGVASPVGRRDATSKVVYNGGASLASGWENWSWSVDYTFGYTGSPALPATLGSSAIQATTSAWAGISFKNSDGGFASYKTFVFWISGKSTSAFGLSIEDVSTAGSSVSLGTLSSCVGAISETSYIPCYFDLTKVAAGPAYNRLTLQAQSPDPQSVVLANLYFTTQTVAEIVDTHSFSAAAAFGSNTLLMIGTGDPTKVKVSRGSTSIGVESRYQKQETPVAGVYLRIATSWIAGSYTITHANGTFSFDIPAFNATTVNGPSYPIDRRIFGVNFPPDAKYLQDANIPLGRWGGNLMTSYNPSTYYVNSAADWYFENRISEGGLPSFLNSIIKPGSSRAVVSVPGLDWVAKGQAPCFSYSVAKYGAQQKTDPYNADAGNGVLVSNGSRIFNDPTDCYVPWSPANLTTWISTMPAAEREAVGVWTLENELDIADGTHADIMPVPMSYKSELDRLVSMAVAIRKAVPNAVIAGPTSCCFWFWWHSAAGSDDMAQHDGVGKIRWLLRNMQAYAKTNKVKLLDVLDLHFNPDTGSSSDGSDADNAIRLKNTRNWWDPTFTCLGYEGQTTVWPANETLPGKIMFIPRFRKLIAEEYPGLSLGATEWYGGQDLVGGLQAADTLGIFAREQMNVATRWYGVDYGTPTYAAYWLLLGSKGNTASPFLSKYINVPRCFNPDLAGVYFATDSKRKAGVFINKDPSKYQSWKVAGLPAGKYTLRHFGRPNTGLAEGARMTVNVTLDGGSNIVVPPYSAVYLAQI
ncbi:glycoside hydrolase family 44-domain-containing protein [Cladochytrium replicatum]|nr:glycoside hydrolase family 44-domain-containing protein [Cladochytrium replicatum]